MKNPKKLGTVQHFCNSEEQKCCTVPKFLCLGTKNLGTVQHFCNPEEQKCCTVPKFLCMGTKNLGTVQHFCSSELQKSCTVPKIFSLGLKSAVLSLKKPKKPILQNLQAGEALKVLENRFFRFFRDSTALLLLWTVKVLYCS